jgi:hypothetical protein
LLASGDFHPPQLVASNFVPFERSLIGGVRRALGRDHTGGWTTSDTFSADESGNLGIAIVVRHDLSFSQLLPFGRANYATTHLTKPFVIETSRRASKKHHCSAIAKPSSLSTNLKFRQTETASSLQVSEHGSGLRGCTGQPVSQKAGIRCA